MYRAASRRPEIEPITQCLGDMRAANPFSARQISQGAGHLEHAVISARRKVEALGRLQQQRLAFLVGIDHLFDQRRTRRGVGEDIGTESFSGLTYGATVGTKLNNEWGLALYWSRTKRSRNGAGSVRIANEHSEAFD